jgi:uncharacterized membrane protein (TIGR02234 family)
MTSGAPRLRGLTPRQQLAVVLLLGAVGAAVVFLAMRAGWAQVRTAAPSPLPASVGTVTGASMLPYVDALVLAALASLAAVLATRRLLRRIVGILLVGLGAGIAVGVSAGLSAAAAVAAAAGVGSSVASGNGAGVGSVTAGGGSSSTALPNVAGYASHVVFSADGWRVMAVAGAIAIGAAGAITAWRATRLPVMAGRYDRPGGSGQPAGGGRRIRAVQAADSASIWESLSRGEDPTSGVAEVGPRRSAAPD